MWVGTTADSLNKIDENEVSSLHRDILGTNSSLLTSLTSYRDKTEYRTQSDILLSKRDRFKKIDRFVSFWVELIQIGIVKIKKLILLFGDLQLNYWKKKVLRQYIRFYLSPRSQQPEEQANNLMKHIHFGVWRSAFADILKGLVRSSSGLLFSITNS